MAEKNYNNNKINQSLNDKDEQRRSSSISSSSSSSSPTSSQGFIFFFKNIFKNLFLFKIEKGQTIVGAFKPFK
jgi:hypothetical protein